MISYADTSFLVSLYLVDRNSAAAKAAVASTTIEFPWTDLHRLEIRNAFGLAVFRGAIAAPDTMMAWRDVMTDLRQGRLTKVPINWPLAMRLAQWHSRRHTGAIGSRSLDVLHVAAATVLGFREFFSFDIRQRTLANSTGLTVRP